MHFSTAGDRSCGAVRGFAQQDCAWAFVCCALAVAFGDSGRVEDVAVPWVWGSAVVLLGCEHMCVIVRCVYVRGLTCI